MILGWKEFIKQDTKRHTQKYKNKKRFILKTVWKLKTHISQKGIYIRI